MGNSGQQGEKSDPLLKVPQQPSTCFNCTRLNSTTFQIVEDDKWFENPIVYAKIFAEVLVLIDTGCGGASRDPNVSLRSLRSFIESYEVADNDNQPLNKGRVKDYVVICSHCHFDHIGQKQDIFAHAVLGLY